MKRIIGFFMILLLSAVAVQAERQIAVTLNGQAMEFDVAPMVIEDRTMVPMRAIFEALGAEVEWLEADQIIIAAKEGIFVSLKIGSNVMIVQNFANHAEQTKLQLDSPPVIVGGRTLVPVRAVSESLGAAVRWNSETNVVHITTLNERGRLEQGRPDNSQNDENGGQV